MPQLVKGIFGVLAVALTFGAFGAVQLASGSDLPASQQDDLQVPLPAGINRAAKVDRAAAVAESGGPTKTILLRLDSLSDTSVLIRIPIAQARNPSPRPAKSSDRKMAVACEPVVSVLTDVAKQLQPGRCVT
jgi:hypothetical protein